MKRIILFIKKFFAWILSFFFDRNKSSKKNKNYLNLSESDFIKPKNNRFK